MRVKMRIGMDIKKIHFYLLKHFLRNILLRYLLLIVCLFLVTKGVVSYRSKEVIRNLLIISLISLVLITLCYKLVKRKVTTMYHLVGDVTAKDVDSLSDIIDLYYIFLESALVLQYCSMLSSYAFYGYGCRKFSCFISCIKCIYNHTCTFSLY